MSKRHFVEDSDLKTFEYHWLPRNVLASNYHEQNMLLVRLKTQTPPPPPQKNDKCEGDEQYGPITIKTKLNDCPEHFDEHLKYFFIPFFKISSKAS